MQGVECLLQRLESNDELYDREARLARVEARPDGLTLDLELTGVYDDLGRERWRLECSAVADWRLEETLLDPIRLWTDHPLLWEGTLRRQELYFTGRPANPLAAAGALLECHLEKTWRYIPPERFFNPYAGALSELLEGGHGSIAIGPAPLIDAYAAVLEGHGSRTSTTEDRAPDLTQEQLGELSEGCPPSVLTLGDLSYVVALTFQAEEIPAE